MANLKNVVYLSEEQYDELLMGETVSGHTYNENNLYLVPSGLYKHSIEVRDNDTGAVFIITIYRTTDRSITDFTEVLYILGEAGQAVLGETNGGYVIGAYAYDGNIYYRAYEPDSASITEYTIVDGQQTITDTVIDMM